MFSDLYRILEQESLVVRSCICTGLTELRNASLNEKGRYYAGFFQIAIGIERMAKLALILDYMAQNNLRPPGQQTVRTYGHDLETLVTTVETITATRGYQVRSSFARSTLCSSALIFLSQFATGMRYANLDGLASGIRQRDPLLEWYTILQSALSNIRPATLQRVYAGSQSIANVLSGSTMIVAQDLGGNALTMTTAISEPALLDYASKFLVWDIVSLLSPLRDVIVEASYAAENTPAASNRSIANIPTMSEFFNFIRLDRSYVLRKRRWP